LHTHTPCIRPFLSDVGIRRLAGRKLTVDKSDHLQQVKPRQSEHRDTTLPRFPVSYSLTATRPKQPHQPPVWEPPALRLQRFLNTSVALGKPQLPILKLRHNGHSTTGAALLSKPAVLMAGPQGKPLCTCRRVDNTQRLRMSDTHPHNLRRSQTPFRSRRHTSKAKGLTTWRCAGMPHAPSAYTSTTGDTIDRNTHVKEWLYLPSRSLSENALNGE
jgi:hypothetical protein